MSRILVIPDIHDLAPLARTILTEWEAGYDKAILLGDFFDSWHGGVSEARDTAQFVKDLTQDPRHILLLANHDAGYRWWWNSRAECSGFSKEKKEAIYSVMLERDMGSGILDNLFNRFKLYHIERGILFTHAGLSKRWMKDNAPSMKNPTLSELGEFLEVRSKQAVESMDAGGFDSILDVGYSRGGWAFCGGVTWCDLGEFQPLPGIAQVFGHTVCKKAPVFSTVNDQGRRYYREISDKHLDLTVHKNGIGLDIDTGLHHYITIEDNTLNIWEVIWTEVVDPRATNSNLSTKKEYTYSKGPCVFSRTLEQLGITI